MGLKQETTQEPSADEPRGFPAPRTGAFWVQLPPVPWLLKWEFQEAPGYSLVCSGTLASVPEVNLPLGIMHRLHEEIFQS